MEDRNSSDDEIQVIQGIAQKKHQMLVKRKREKTLVGGICGLAGF